MTATPLESRCESTPAVEVSYADGTDQTPADAVVNAVADANGIDVTDLPPMQETVDLDALNQLFNQPSETRTVLVFEIDTWCVLVDSDGQVCVYDNTESGTHPEHHG